MPPVAAATKNVRDGDGMPSISVTRPPMFAGPIERQRYALRSVESRGVVSCACARDVVNAMNATAMARSRRDMMRFSELFEFRCRAGMWRWRGRGTSWVTATPGGGEGEGGGGNCRAGRALPHGDRSLRLQTVHCLGVNRRLGALLAAA